MTYKILCTIDGFAEEGQSILKSIGPTEVRRLSQNELPSTIADCSCLVTSLSLMIDRAVIDAAPNLRCIATPTTGLDHIDVAYAASKGVMVLSLKGETGFLTTVTATAELALGLMIALIRKIPAAHSSVLRGEWDRAAFCGHSLAGKTLGIVGFGRLGSMMGNYSKALGMNVIFTDPKKRGGVPLPHLLKTADVISLHVPLTEQTERMITTKELQLLKPTAVLINTSRGKIVDEEALIMALDAGTLTGYAADVLAEELSFMPQRARSTIIDYANVHDNVLITPHIGGMTAEARQATDIFIAKKVKHYLEQR